MTQVPLLLGAHKFATNTNSSSHNRVHYIGHNHDSTILVGGDYYDDVVVDLLDDSQSLQSTYTNVTGFLTNYDSDFELHFAQNTGSSVYWAQKRIDGTVDLIGRFNSNSPVLGIYNDEPLALSTFQSAFESLVMNRSSDGSINWFKQSNRAFQMACRASDKIYVVGHGGSNPIRIADLQDTTTISVDGAWSEGFTFVFDTLGNFIDYYLISGIFDDYVRDVSYSEILNEITLTGRSGSSMDFQWNGISSHFIEHDGPAAFAASYDDTHELRSLFIITNQDADQNDRADAWGTIYDDSGNLYIAATLQQGNYNLIINDLQQQFTVTSPHEHHLFKLNVDKDLVWKEVVNLSHIGILRDIGLDKNGAVYISGFFNNQMQFDQSSIILQGSQEAGFLASWSPEGDLIWAYSIEDGGHNEIRTMCFTPDNEMYIGGGFSSFSTDFDFTEAGTYDLGQSNGIDPFIAKYTIANPTADVFVEQGWQTTQVTEGGAVDKIYVRLSHAPTAPVQVVLTPDAQLDLGNGAGNGVTLTFAANSTAVLQQTINVSAYDDNIVEGAHTGIISFDISSADAAFNVLTENNITVSITDNDIVGIGEQQEVSFSLSPNPAKDVLNIVLDAATSNTVISIFDESGKLVQTTSTSDNRHSINTSGFAVGKYSMVVEQGKQRTVKAFVVTK